MLGFTFSRNKYYFPDLYILNADVNAVVSMAAICADEANAKERHK